MTVNTGPRYRIGTVAIRPPGTMVSLPDVDRSKIGLAPGDPADAAAILSAEDRVLLELRKQGYALATVKREVVVDHATREAEVTYTAEPGPTAKMGKVRFSGTEKVDTAYCSAACPSPKASPTIPPRSSCCAASSPRSASSTPCASSPPPRSIPTANCRSTSISPTGRRAPSALA